MGTERAMKLCYRRLCALISAVFLLLMGMRLPIAAKDLGEVRRGKTEGMRIALTFDDGPHPTQTPQILAILERYGVKATFFMVGVNVENYPDAARAVPAGGHEVGNHTFSHHRIAGMSREEIQREIDDCADTLERVCGYRPSLFRPPEGSINDTGRECLKNAHYTPVLWSLDTRDWECKDRDTVVNTVLSHVRPGDIILMHDYIGHGSKTPEALEELLPRLLSMGFEPVTVGELVG